MVSDDEWSEPDTSGADTELVGDAQPGSQPPRDSSTESAETWTGGMPFSALCAGALLENGVDDADDDTGDAAARVGIRREPPLF